MKHFLAAVAATSLAVASVAAQSGGTTPAANWKVPRTADGRPDLQGVWSNNSVTPMARPSQWKDKASLTDAEVTELKALVAQSVDPGGDAVFQDLVQVALTAKEGKYKQLSYDASTGNYNQFWMADRDWDNRTSLITDPPNGQLPALTPQGAGPARSRPGTGSGGDRI